MLMPRGDVAGGLSMTPFHRALASLSASDGLAGVATDGLLKERRRASPNALGRDLATHPADGPLQRVAHRLIKTVG
jgi:hypothetical protein